MKQTGISLFVCGLALFLIAVVVGLFSDLGSILIILSGAIFWCLVGHSLIASAVRRELHQKLNQILEELEKPDE